MTQETTDLDQLLADATARYNAMTPLERAEELGR